MSDWHLAQLNVARLRHPIDAPETQGFVDALDPINALAEASPGYVWRLQDDSGNATSMPFRGDPDWIANLTVWESIEALRDFTYRSDHVDVLRQRGAWFDALDVVEWDDSAGVEPLTNA